MEAWIISGPPAPKLICELCPSLNAECGAFEMFTDYMCWWTLLVIIFSIAWPRNERLEKPSG